MSSSAEATIMPPNTNGEATASKELTRNFGPMPQMSAIYRRLKKQKPRRKIFPAPQAAIPDHHVWRSPAWFRGGNIIGPCKTFTCFAKLPAELRLKVWGYAQPGPRLVIDTTYNKDKHKDIGSHEISWRSRGPNTDPTTVTLDFDHKLYRKIPVTLHICAESRAETLKIYTAVGHQYMNFSIDTLWIPKTLHHTFWIAFSVFHKVGWVQSIMLETLSSQKGGRNHPFFPPGRNPANNLRDDIIYRLWKDRDDIRKHLPNLKEIIVKYPFELPNNSNKGSWDDSNEADKPTNFRKFLLTTKDLDRAFGKKDSMKRAQRSNEREFQIHNDDYIFDDMFKDVEFKCLIGKDTWIESNRNWRDRPY